MVCWHRDAAVVHTHSEMTTLNQQKCEWPNHFNENASTIMLKRIDHNVSTDFFCSDVSHDDNLPKLIYSDRRGKGKLPKSHLMYLHYVRSFIWDTEASSCNYRHGVGTPINLVIGTASTWAWPSNLRKELTNIASYIRHSTWYTEAYNYHNRLIPSYL